MKRDHFEHQQGPLPVTAAHEEKILRRLFHGYPGGLAVRLPSGATLTIGADAPGFTLVFRQPGVTVAVYRLWRLYMAACAIEFENGEVGVHQILASKRDGGLWPVPLTRRDLYI